MTMTDNTDVSEAADQVEGQEPNDLDEGDIAADYLEELLDIADLDGDIDIEVRGGRTYISIVTESGDGSLDSLVGKHGEVLDSLQELTRLAVLNATGERSRLVLDIDGHRAGREAQLHDLAHKAIEEVKSTGESVHMDPMSAYERKLVHDVIAAAGLHSESEGEANKRHIVVTVGSN